MLECGSFSSHLSPSLPRRLKVSGTIAGIDTKQRICHAPAASREEALVHCIQLLFIGNQEFLGPAETASAGLQNADKMRRVEKRLTRYKKNL
jgi:hypothetical protein